MSCLSGTSSGDKCCTKRCQWQQTHIWSVFIWYFSQRSKLTIVTWTILLYILYVLCILCILCFFFCTLSRHVNNLYRPSQNHFFLWFSSHQIIQGSPVGTILFRAHATDEDTGNAGLVFYEIDNVSFFRANNQVIYFDV